MMRSLVLLAALSLAACASGPEAQGQAQPINANCPATGRAVDPEHTVVYEGAVIGFCCNNCKSDFVEGDAATKEKMYSKASGN